MWKALVNDATKRQKMCEINSKNPNYPRYLMEESANPKTVDGYVDLRQKINEQKLKKLHWTHSHYQIQKSRHHQPPRLWAKTRAKCYLNHLKYETLKLRKNSWLQHLITFCMLRINIFDWISWFKQTIFNTYSIFKKTTVHTSLPVFISKTVAFSTNTSSFLMWQPPYDCGPDKSFTKP